MATQFSTASNPVAAPAHRARKMMQPDPTRPIARLNLRREQRPIQTCEDLVVAVLPLVKGVALKIRKRLPAHVELDDLISDEVLGLVDALAKYNPSKRVKLQSYARHRIRGSILDGLRSADPVPRDIRRKHRNLEKQYKALEAKLGRPAKDEEMAGGLGLNLAQWHRELNDIQSAGIDCGARALSVAPIFVPTSADPALLAGDGSNPFDLCSEREQREIFSPTLSELGERERQILTLYYKRGLSMREISVRMNVNASRVSQLHAAALVRLKAKVDCMLGPPSARRATSGNRSMAASVGR